MGKRLIVLMAGALLALSVGMGGVALANEDSEKHVVKAAYPLEVCVVSGMKLGSMGDVVTYVHDGQEIRLCCKACVGQVKKDPEKYLKMISDAYDKQKK